MTCIVGIAENNKVYMGADSCASDFHSWLQMDNPKICEVGEFLIGVCGSARMIDLLTYSLTGCIQRPEDSDDKFMRTTFINNVKECFKQGNFGTDERGGNFLVGYKGKLYEVQDDYSIINSSQWGMSVGSGALVARGSLYTSKTGQIKLGDEGSILVLSPEHRITLALQAAESVVISVRGPFIIKSK